MASAERGMLKYMGDTCVIWGVSFEANREDIVLVVSGNVQILRSSFLMLESKSSELQFRDMLLALEHEPMQIFPKLWRLVEAGH